MLDLTRYKALTFDCYGTLIDWEMGILGSLKPLLAAHGVTLEDAAILEDYGAFEANEEHGAFQSYSDVLRGVAGRFGAKYGFACADAERETLIANFSDWKPFSDTVPALQSLARHYSLNIVSNVDNALFAITAQYLPVKFDHVVTAQQVGSYKPSFRNFEAAQKRMNLLPEEILHVAQSLFHDIAPANELGLANVWVNRRSAVRGFGATPPAEATPNLEVADLKTLAQKVEEAFA